MSYTKISIQFASMRNLWAFRKEVQLNAFYVNIEKLTITFEPPMKDIGCAIEKYYGQVVQEKQNA